MAEGCVNTDNLRAEAVPSITVTVCCLCRLAGGGTTQSVAQNRKRKVITARVKIRRPQSSAYTIVISMVVHVNNTCYSHCTIAYQVCLPRMPAVLGENILLLSLELILRMQM